MTGEIGRENRRQARKGTGKGGNPDPAEPSNIQTLPRPRSQGFLVPPIRSLTTRDPLHYTSNATLRVETDGQGRNESPSGPKADAATTITQAIAQLESILEEACRLAQTVGEVGRQAVTPSPQPTPTRRRPSESIAHKGTKYLEQANKSETSNPAPSNRTPRGSRRAALHVIHPLDVIEPDHMHDLAEPTQRTESGLEILPPRPMEETSLGRIPSKVRIAEDGALPSRADLKVHICGLGQIPVASRTSSSQPQETGLERPSSLKVPPTLRLNDQDMPEVRNQDQDTAALRSSFSRMFGIRTRHASVDLELRPISKTRTIDLKRISHVDVQHQPDSFDVFDTCSHAPIARDWPTSRKRFTAAIVCLNTLSLGILIGIYAGEVPAIQYRIADFHHYSILGNVVLYCGLAFSTLFFWPLPLLHGRKPYTLMGLALTFGLQVPQGVAIGGFRMPGDMAWRILLFLSRALSGFALGLVNINSQATMLDLFGSSLQSQHPHGEIPDPYDVRRHGGGMGLWLAVWSWCSIGSISFGFVIGAFLIENTSVDWGFWIALLLLMIVIVLNVITPEVRRSAFRRTVAEFAGHEGAFSRVARGEIKMHLERKGPYWWGEEVQAGLQLSWSMAKQPGFLILAIYAAWAYAQFTLVMMLLGALTSKDYRYRPVFVGLCILSMVLGSLLAVPFQKASVFSRARTRRPRTDSQTFQESVFWTSHIVRRCLFTILLPLAALGFAFTSWGPPFPVAVPCAFSAVVAYTSNLAIAECFGLIMETFDTSDLQPGMKGRPARRRTVTQLGGLRTNFSCYPRVSAGMAVTQSLQFVFAAVATGLGGSVERRIGAMQASFAVAGILLVLTFLLALVLWRWKSEQMIPDRQQSDEMVARQHADWEPVVLGRPSGITRKLSILEMGRETRWSEIRSRNRLNTGLAGS